MQFFTAAIQFAANATIDHLYTRPKKVHRIIFKTMDLSIEQLFMRYL